eukprot:g54663.t1
MGTVLSRENEEKICPDWRCQGDLVMTKIRDAGQQPVLKKFNCPKCGETPRPTVLPPVAGNGWIKATFVNQSNMYLWIKAAFVDHESSTFKFIDQSHILRIKATFVNFRDKRNFTA